MRHHTREQTEVKQSRGLFTCKRCGGILSVRRDGVRFASLCVGDNVQNTLMKAIEGRAGDTKLSILPGGGGCCAGIRYCIFITVSPH